jgi:hypothetical protein
VRDLAPLRRDRGHVHRRPRRRHRRRPDQDRRAGALRAGREVQPAAADRGGARGPRALRRPLRHHAVARSRARALALGAGPRRAARSTSICCRRATRAARLARTSRRGWPTPRRASTSWRGARWSPTTRCRRSTGGSVTTRARASATAPSSTARSRSTRSSGSSATSRSSDGWQCDPPPASAAPGAGDRLRAERAVGRLPPGPARPRGRDPRRRPRAGRDDALRDPVLPDATRRARRRAGRIVALGVRITSGHRVEDLGAERAEGGFDAVFVAVGAHLSKRVEIPARDAGPIVDAVSFLRGVASGERPVIGRRVAVYGGGNTAMDAARVARRLGAEETLIVYRRTREQMPAHEEEAQDAEREGCGSTGCARSQRFEGPELNVEVMEARRAGYPQPTGRVRDARRRHGDPGARPGDRHRLPAWRCRGSSSTATAPCRCRAVADDRRPGVFAGGDMVPSERTVTSASGTARRPPADRRLAARGAAVTAAAKHDRRASRS